MKRTFVTTPHLPDIDKFISYVKEIWGRQHLTNQGPLVQELESKLGQILQTALPIHLVCNGGIGLQIILKSLGITGEIVTTPFSYVATTSCPLWEGCSLRFADIEADYLTIDPQAIEATITSKSEAILATHVFGNPCNVEALEKLAQKHGLALIYDAAHAFGVSYKNRSILEYGDASMVSLHATKLIHSVEGGFVVAADPSVAKKLEWMRRFGHKGSYDFHGVGINAKMNEFCAAMGLCCLEDFDPIIQARSSAVKWYREALSSHSNIKLLPIRDATDWNFAYFPIIFEAERHLTEAMNKMNAHEIYPRRYFYPSLDELAFTKSHQSEPCAVSADISRRILCLPLSSTITKEQVDMVINLLKAA